MKFLKILGAGFGIVALVYFLGPKPKFAAVDASIPNLSISIDEVSEYLKNKEAKIGDLKSGNGYQLQFFDGVKKTPYVLIYLHGFSASPVEGDPIHVDFAKHYSMNYYAPLLAGHGRDTDESFAETQPQDWVADAAEAMAIGKLLGEKIIVMSCSTGSTLSVYLEAEHPTLIAGQIMYSPNLDLADPKSKLLTGPWGNFLAHKIIGDYRSYSLSPAATPFWTTKYRIEGLIALRNLLDQTMTKEIWQAIEKPFMIAYYYENEEQKDEVISTKAITDFERTTGTVDQSKRILPMPEPQTHVICSSLQSKNIEVVRIATYDFAEEVLKLTPIVIPEPVLSEPF